MSKIIETLMEQDKEQKPTDIREYSEMIEEIKKAADKIPTAIETKKKTVDKGFELQAFNMADIIENPEKITKNPFFVVVGQALHYEIVIPFMQKGYDIELTFSNDGGSTKISWIKAEDGHIATLEFYYDNYNVDNKKLAALWGYIDESSKGAAEKPTVVEEITVRCLYELNGTILKRRRLF